MSLPIILVAPHSHSTVPSSLAERMALSEYEIWKCSDPYTDLLDEFTCASRKHTAEVSRLICDLNRAPNAENAFRDFDFYGHQVFRDGEGLTPAEKEDLLTRYWFPFHEKIVDSVLELDREGNEVILLVDFHNTSGDHPLNNQNDYMPSMILSNLGAENTGESTRDNPTISLPHDDLDLLRDAIMDRLDISVEINRVYRGGYNLHWYASLPEILDLNARVFSVQIEYNLDYVFDPSTRRFDRHALKLMQTGLNESLEWLYENLSGQYGAAFLARSPQATIQDLKIR
jgi:hypothetical protein